MNICFLIGKIVSKIDFEFMINNKEISIAIFKIQLKNKSELTVKAYNYLADFCYSKLIEGDIIAIQGYLSNNQEIIIEEIKIDE